MSIDFINELKQIIFLDKEQELGENERKILEEVYKNNLIHFLNLPSALAKILSGI